MSMLSDMTVVPSYLSTLASGILRDTGIQTNTSLHFGEVKELIYPSDPRNVNRRYIEYAVDVYPKIGSGPRTVQRYYGCLLSNPFGGGADTYRYTLRAAPKTSASSYGPGSKVLLLCTDGDQTKAVILAGMRDNFISPDGFQGVDTNQGHNLFWEFNGLQCVIDQQGALTVTFKGPTKSDGSFNDSTGVDQNLVGSSLQLQSDGSVLIASGGPEDTQQNLQIDNTNNTFTIIADNQFIAHGAGTMTFTIQDDVRIQSEKGMMELDADGVVSVISAGLHVGKATDAFLLGTSFRNAQSRMNKQVAQALQQAVQNLQTAASIPTWSVAAAYVMSASWSLLSAANALSAFEANSQTYLSKVNFSD